MAKKRYVNTQFWRDSYISNLDPSEKLLFLYLITNPDTNISGIYQIPLKIIATDTGFDKEMVLKILARFEKDEKIKYENGWIALKNFQKNQNEKSLMVVKGIENEMQNAPESLRIWIKLEKVEGIDTLSHLNLNLDSNIDIKQEKIKEIPEDYRETFDYWNSKEFLITHKDISIFTNAFSFKRFKELIDFYNIDEIKKAIDNYNTILSSDKYFFNYKWSIGEFFSRNNGIHKFFDSAEPLKNFKSKFTTQKPTNWEEGGL